MIFQQNTQQSTKPQKNDILRIRQMKNTTHHKDKPQKTQKFEENNNCFCFSSKKHHKVAQSSDPKFRTLPDQSLKEQALKLSREIAQKSFKHLKNGFLSPRNSFSHNNTLQTTKPSFQKSQKIQSSKDQVKNAVTKQEKGNENEKQQFNMSRLTFSVVNRSYQKTVNNTVSSNNTSIFCESNILGSVVSQAKNDIDRVRSQKQSGDESFSSISSINKRNSGKGLRSQLDSRKGIKIVRTGQQIEPIQQENEEVETKRYKFIRVKAKELNMMPKNVNEENRFQIKTIQTQQKLQSSQQEEQEENVKYDYSSIVIDFFNMDPQMLQTLQEIKQNEKPQNIIEPQNQEIFKTHPKDDNHQALIFTPQASSISRQTSFSSLTSYNPVQSISSSNIRSIFAASGVSSESNFLSMSINNNFSECSFDSIAKKQIKWPYRGNGEFDGLSCINQNEESQVQGRNQTQIQYEQGYQNKYAKEEENYDRL